MSLLFTPLSLKHLTLKNRVIVSPMCQYSAIDGFAVDWHLVHLGSRAVGGAALVIQEATAVSPEGRISPDDLGIWKDEHINKYRQITDFIHQQHALAGIQLAHAGRKASTAAPWKGRGQLSASTGGWQTFAPSPVGFNETDIPPIALNLDQIKTITEAFRIAAKRAVQAGYDVIELHAAHGYLLHQFLSPLSNQRVDEYGGSFENRIRFLLEIIDAVKPELTGNHSLWVRISATDWAEGGWDIQQSIQLAEQLKTAGVELIDTSSGALIPGVKIPTEPGYQVPFAAQIKSASGILTGAVGLITTPDQSEKILSQQQADVILLARELLRDPYFPLHAGIALDGDIPFPNQYERAKIK